MTFVSYNEAVGAGGHSILAAQKMRFQAQETSGTTSLNTVTGNNRTVAGYVPTADVGPGGHLPNALVEAATLCTVDLASLVSLGNRTYIGWAYIPSTIGNAKTAWLVDGQFTNGRCGVDYQGKMVANRTTQVSSSAGLCPLDQWVKLCFRHDGANWTFDADASQEVVAHVAAGTSNLRGLRTDGSEGVGVRLADWSAYNVVLDDADLPIYFRGNEPIRSAHPVLSQDNSTWWATTGTYGLPTPLAADANGAITYEWELRLTADDSVIQSGTGTPGGAKPTAGTYYVWVRASNTAGYDVLQDGQSADVALTAAEITSAVIGNDGTTFSITGSTTLANYSGFSMSGYTLTPVSGTGTSTLVYSLSPTVDQDAAPTLNYTAGDVTIGGSALGNFTGYTVTNNSTQNVDPPYVVSAALSDSALTVVLNESVTNYTGLVLTSDTGIPTALTYSSGDTTNTLVFTPGRTTGGFETFTLSYTPGDIVDGGANALEAFSGTAVTNNSTATQIWKPTILDASGVLLILEAVDTSGSIALSKATGATGDLTVNLGSGAFTIASGYIGIEDVIDKAYAIIPEANRVASPPSVTVSASAGWLKTSAEADMPALSQTLAAGDILQETIPSVTPRQQTDFGINFGTLNRYSGSLLWSNLARLFNYGWRTGSHGGTAAALTDLGLPAVAATTYLYALSDAAENLPDEPLYIMWDGDVSIDFLVSSGRGPDTTDLDTTSGTKRWKKLSWSGGSGDALWLTCSGDCSSITRFVVCRESDWDDTAKDTATVLVPESLERFAGVAHIRGIFTQQPTGFTCPDVDHISPAGYLPWDGVVEIETAAITNIENYTTNAAYYTTDGDYFGQAGGYDAEGSSILKVTHDGTVAFRTGDPVTFDSVVGAIDGTSFNDNYRLYSFGVYVPTGATTYFYMWAKSLDARVEFTYTSGGNAVVTRDYGPPPEGMAEIANYLEENCSLTHIWLWAGHNESVARQAAYAARLNAALNSTIKIYCEWGNEWVFNYLFPFGVGFYHARNIPNVSGVTGMNNQWDAGAYYLSEYYDTMVAEFGADRIVPVIAGQTWSPTGYAGILDSTLLTAPVTIIAGTNYFGNYIAAFGYDDLAADTITPSAMCTFASEVISSTESGSWAPLAAFADGRSLSVVNYEGGTHMIPFLDHPISYTSGWTLAAGNRYTQSDARYVVSLKNGSTTLTKAADATACESTSNSFFWDSVGSVLHVNLGGTDPNTVTLSAMRIDRIGMAARYAVNHPRYSRVYNQMFDVCDTLGIKVNQNTVLGRHGNDLTVNESYVWGAYGTYEMAPDDGVGTPDNATLVEQVYRGDITVQSFYSQIGSVRGYEVNRWTDPANFIPTITSITRNVADTETTVVFSKAVQPGADGWTGLVVGGVAQTYSSGTTTDTIVFTSSAVGSGTITGAYTQPGDGIQDSTAGLLETISGVAVTNNVPGDTAPTVTTADATGITSSGATVGGNVTADGGATVTSRGVYWALTTGPTALDNVETAGTGGTGTYTVPITGVAQGTTVYVIAWATNSAGTSTGSEITFTTSAEISVVFNVFIYMGPSSP